MKKLIILLVLIFACYIAYSKFQEHQENKLIADREKIHQLEEACKTVATSPVVYSLGSNAGQWYILELELIHQKDEEPYQTLENILGADFETKLSNDDKIFVGFLPYAQSFRIYVGGTDEANMVYPDWNYTGLSKGE